MLLGLFLIDLNISIVVRQLNLRNLVKRSLKRESDFHILTWQCKFKHEYYFYEPTKTLHVGAFNFNFISSDVMSFEHGLEVSRVGS